MTKIQNNSRNTTDPRRNFSPPLDTLAQPGTKGEISRKNTLKKRARAKFITNEVVFGLVDTQSHLKHSYWNTFHCSHTLHQEGNEIKGKYCNNRWCQVCNRIRMGKLINEYLPVLKDELNNPQFVTLTVPNVPGEVLRAKIQDLVFSSIRINHNFRHRRGYRLKGIRKVETTYNRNTGLFHPHLHYLIDGTEAGHALIDEWLRIYPEADRAAQDIRPADQGSLTEIFKYSTKLVTKNDITRHDGIVEINTDPVALDIIFRAMYKLRTFQPLGIKKRAVSEDIEATQTEPVADLTPGEDVWTWDQSVSDWISTAGEQLTGCDAHKVYKVNRAPVPISLYTSSYNQYHSESWIRTLDQFAELNRHFSAWSQENSEKYQKSLP